MSNKEATTNRKSNAPRPSRNEARRKLHSEKKRGGGTEEAIK